jgi:hypothetical protein
MQFTATIKTVNGGAAMLIEILGWLTDTMRPSLWEPRRSLDDADRQPRRQAIIGEDPDRQLAADLLRILGPADISAFAEGRVLPKNELAKIHARGDGPRGKFRSTPRR